MEQIMKALKIALETLENNRRVHHDCEDTWYSCPKSAEGCANEDEGDECNCGADEANREIDSAIVEIKQALAGLEQEPVATVKAKRHGGTFVHWTKLPVAGMRLYGQY